MMNQDSDREATCKVVSKYFSSDCVMDESSKEIRKEKQSTSKKAQEKNEKTRKRSNKKIKGQKDIRTLIKSKKNELLKFNKDFDLVCKQSGVDVDPEQLQLAIALSKSLQDNKSEHDGTDTEKTLTCNQRRNKIRVTLREYGFKTNIPPGKKVKKYRKHYKLLLAPDTEKLQRIGDKYAQILIQNLKIYKRSDENLPYFDNTNSCIYNLATNVSYDCIKNDDIFYVDDLLPKSLHVKHMFKDWSKIPGRPVSPELKRAVVQFKSIQCSQEELDNILSGSVETAQDIVNSLIKVQSNEVVNIPIEEVDVNYINSLKSELEDIHTRVSSENKTSQDSLTNSSIKILCNMTLPINRSCSPDLFDDEVTIIMDTSKHKISANEEVTEKIVTTKDQNDFMDLTECVGITNHNTINSKHYGCLSQEKNSTKRNPNDFMDLTECVTTSSQKKTYNVQNSCSYVKVSDSSAKQNNKEISIDQSSNFPKNTPSNICSDEKSLNDTIIMIDEEYSNIIPRNNCSVVNSTSKEIVLIDLVGDQRKSSKTQITFTTHNNSIIDLDQSVESNIATNIEKKLPTTNADQDIGTCILSSKNLEGNKKPDTIDLTQACDYDDCLSYIHIHSVNSISTYEIPMEAESMPIQTSRNFGDKMVHENEYTKDKESDNLAAMDLTQSSNSEEGLQNEPYISNKLDKDCNVNDLIIGNLEEDLTDYVNVYNSSPVQDTLTHNAEKYQNIESIPNRILTISNTENDNAFQHVSLPNMNEELRNGKSSNYLESCSFENAVHFRELDLTQHSDFSRDGTCDPNDVINALPNTNNDSDETEDGGKSNKIRESTKEIDDLSHNSRIIKSNEFCTDFNNVIEFPKGKQCSFDTSNLSSRNEDLGVFKNTNKVGYDTVIDENSDIDLTQQSDSSEHTLNISEVIDVPDELGKRNNVSIDYDEVCAEPYNSRECEIIPSLDDNKFTERENVSKEDGASSSQHSEAFELSDNEFNYSVKQHIQDIDSLILKPAEFDIGGISTIDDILSQNSLARRSKLRCSCSSNNEANIDDNRVEDCLSVTLKSTGNVISNNVNRESTSCDDVEFVRITTPIKSKSDNNILIAKTPKHDDYVIKTDQVTPMPNYEIMTSPERNEELDKFGIKSLKRKRAIQLLTHIYNQTHPLMEVISETAECTSPSKKRRKKYDVQSLPTRTIASQINPNSTEPNDPILQVIEPNLTQKPSKSCKELTKNTKKSPQKKHISSESSNANKDNVSYEETTSVPDIRNIECCPEDWIFQKREKAKVHSCRVPLHIAFHNYVSSRRSLREAILKYEPINIDDIHKGLVAIGYRYNPKDLLKFMDKKCITVKTADNSRKNKNT